MKKSRRKIGRFIRRFEKKNGKKPGIQDWLRFTYGKIDLTMRKDDWVPIMEANYNVIEIDLREIK